MARRQRGGTRERREEREGRDLAPTSGPQENKIKMNERRYGGYDAGAVAYGYDACCTYRRPAYKLRAPTRRLAARDSWCLATSLSAPLPSHSSSLSLSSPHAIPAPFTPRCGSIPQAPATRARHASKSAVGRRASRSCHRRNVEMRTRMWPRCGLPPDMSEAVLIASADLTSGSTNDALGGAATMHATTTPGKGTPAAGCGRSE